MTTSKHVSYTGVINTMKVYIPYVVGVTGEYENIIFSIPKMGMMIGRDDVACRICFKNNMKVSRHHCMIIYNNQAGFFVLRDLNSTHGTFKADGKKIGSGESVILHPGEMFSLCGDIKFRTKIM